MRSFALLLLGAGLLWLVLRPPSSSEEPEVRASGVPAGVMLAPEADDAPKQAGTSASTQEPANVAPTSVVPGTQGRVDGTTSDHPTEPGIVLSSNVAAPLVAPDSAAPRDRSHSSAAETSAVGERSDEVELAERLAHAPASVGEFLRQRPSAVSSARRELARVLGSIASGDIAEARRASAGLDYDAGITSEEADFVKRATAGSDAATARAGATRGSLLVRAAAMPVAIREAETRLKAGEHAAAAELVSEVLIEEFRAPWQMDPARMRAWVEVLRRAQSGYRWRKDARWPAVELKVEKGDSLISVRKRVVAAHSGLLMCTGLIARANGLTGEVIHPGQTLRIPTDPVRMLVDLDGHWALYLMGDEAVEAWEVGVGKPGSETRAGDYRVGDKRRDPMWFPVGEAPVPFGDPRNPLGTRWIELEGVDGRTTHLGIHGTNDPASVGRDASEGCLRMRNEEVEALFEIIPQGTVVLIQA
jgi:hypothetical protein